MKRDINSVLGGNEDAAIERLYDAFCNWYHDDGSFDTFLKSEALKEIKCYALTIGEIEINRLKNGLREAEKVLRWTWNEMGKPHHSDHYNIPANGLSAIEKLLTKN